MNKLVSPFVGGLLAISLSFTPVAVVYAVPDCAAANSDPDGDGWGWENGESCLVVDVDPPAQSPTWPTSAQPVCVNGDSDADGDGWGWENNQSCVVQPTTQPVPDPEPMPDPDPNMDVIPGQSLQTAASINLDSPVSGILPASSVATHWYQFTVDHQRPIAVRVIGSSDTGVELLVQFADGVSVVEIYLDDPFDRGYLCIPPATYYVQVRHAFSEDIDSEYTFSVRSSAFVCEHPDVTNNDAGEFLGVVPGGYLSLQDSRILSSHTHDGVVRWQYQLNDYAYSPLAVVSANSVYLAAGDTVYSFDLNGNLNWQFSGPQYSVITAMLVTDDSVYFGADGSLYSLNLNGAPRWIHNVLGQSVDGIRLGDNGSLYVAHGYDRLSVFNGP